MKRNSHVFGTFLWLVLLLLACLTANGQAANNPSQRAASPSAKVPTCQAVSQAIVAAYGPVVSVKDETPGLPYEAPMIVYRGCYVYLAGNKVPLSITFAGPADRQSLETLAQGAARYGYGGATRKLDGAGYGDLAYLKPQIGGGTGINALVGNILVTIGSWTNAADTENIAQHIIKLM